MYLYKLIPESLCRGECYVSGTSVLMICRVVQLRTKSQVHAVLDP